MASSHDLVIYVCEQMSLAGSITYKKMFGEYGLYYGGKLFGSICDNQVFIKPTAAAERLLPTAQRQPPYDGAKAQIVLEDLDDKEFLAELITSTCAELPPPKPKKTK